VVADFMKRLGAIAVPTVGIDRIGTIDVRHTGDIIVHHRRNGAATTGITVTKPRLTSTCLRDRSLPTASVPLGGCRPAGYHRVATSQSLLLACQWALLEIAAERYLFRR
jgi:hypothetical protein